VCILDPASAGDSATNHRNSSVAPEKIDRDQACTHAKAKLNNAESKKLFARHLDPGRPLRKPTHHPVVIRDPAPRFPGPVPPGPAKVHVHPVLRWPPKAAKLRRDTRWNTRVLPWGPADVFLLG
jgi:hypothetical protein